MDYLVERFPSVNATTWSNRMAKGQVLDETGLRLKPQSAYRVGACVFYYREIAGEKRIPFDECLLYQDEHILVVDKPHFLPVMPSGRFLHQTLLVRLRKQGGPDSLVPVHRLDRETAGVVLFSLNPKTTGHYTSLFRNRKVVKVYKALAPTLRGLDFPLTRRSRIVTGEPFFRMKEVEGEPNSETHVDVLQSLKKPFTGDAKLNGVTLYRLNPITGRKHQLRLHLSALGIPIVNDRLYPDRSFVDENDFSEPLKLLARSVSFFDPLTGQERYFESGRKL
jgi:tRNA pseudouridine32 synthase/23S rRNA pseudouridine746 synthase